MTDETETPAKPAGKKTVAKVTVNDKMKQAAVKAGADEGRVTDLVNEYAVNKQVFEELKSTLKGVTDKVKVAEKKLAETVTKLDKLGQNPEPVAERQVGLVDANKAYFANGRKEREQRLKTAEMMRKTVGELMPGSKSNRRTQRNIR